MTPPNVAGDSSGQLDLKLLYRLIVAQRVCLAVASVIAAGILSGWLVPAIGSVFPGGWTLMKANTAVVVLLSAASLLLTGSKRSDRRLLLGRLLALIVFLLAGSALLEHWTGRAFGLATLLSADSRSPMAGLMSVQTGTFFVLMAVAVVFDGKGKGIPRLIVDASSIGLFIVFLVVLAGYWFGALKLVGQTTLTRTSPQTLVCMALLGFAVAVRRTRSGYFSVLGGVGIGSQIARKALPFALVLPLLTVRGGLYLFTSGVVRMEYAGGLIAALTSILVLALIVAMGRKINDLERALRDLSLVDELTGIYNRRGFSLLGEHALRDGRRASAPLTVLYFDLDGLKTVNDTLGHDVGSRLLLDFSNLLRMTFRGSDVVARIGGDEFAVVGRYRDGGLAIALRRLEEATEAANRAGGPYRISYSMGEAHRDPGDGGTFSELVDRADAMMYERKQRKKAGRPA